MHLKIRIASTVLAMACALAVGAEHHEEAADAAPGDSKARALEILKAADAATKAVTVVSFKGSVVPSGAATGWMKSSTGHGVMAGWNADLGMPARFYGVVETERDGAMVKVEGGGDGENFYIIDHATRKGYEDMDPGVMGTLGMALRNIGMIEMVHAEPFGDEFDAELSYLGAEDVGGVLCDKVHVVYSGGQGASTWYFSQEDHLPRRRTRHFEIPQGDGAIDVRMMELDLAPKLEGVKFSMQLAEGYEAVDDFAP